MAVTRFGRLDLRLLLVLLFVPVLLGFAANGDGDVAVDAHSLSLSTVDDSGPGEYESDPVAATFTMFGLTWEGRGPSEAWYRTDPGDGTWTAWESIAVASDDEPDLAAGETDRGRSGTDLTYTGPGERIQFRTSGGSVRGFEVVLLDTTNPDGAAAAPFDPHAFTPSSGSLPPRPVIHPRTEWDPTNRCVPRVTPEEIQVTTAIVHHTGGTNRAYPANEVPDIILGYCLYHRNSRGWNDLAYNLMVDRFGTIWEGRAGGVEMGIRGGHAKGFSSYSTGIAMIGNFMSAAPPAAEVDALESLLAWKLSVHNLDPAGTTSVISMGSYKYDEGVPVTMDTITGHRDVQATACPGTYAYSLMPTIRSDVAAMWTPPPADSYAHPVSGDFDGDGSEEGAVYRRSDGTWWLYDSGTVTVALDGPDGQSVTAVAAADVDGDGSDEIITLSGANVAVMNLSGGNFASAGAGSVGSGSGWSLDVGDVTGDGAEDVVFVDGSGTARVLAGGSVSPWGSIGSGHPLTVVGDFDGDGRSDLAGLRNDGRVDVALSTGSGFGTAGIWGDAGPTGGWQFAVAGDFDADGDDDVAAFRSSSQTWYGLLSTGTKLRTSLPVKTPTLDHWSEAFAFDYRSDGRVEVIALNAYTGTWHLGRFDLSQPVFTRLEDGPYRTTVERNGPASGTSFLTWYGQEFAWVNAELGYGKGGEAEITTRIYGPSRYDTAAMVTRAAFASADTVFVGTGKKYPDALTGGSAAVLSDSPMLLTDPKSLPASTRDEIVRLGARRVILLGGTAAVSAAVERQLAALVPDGVTRIGGADRYETAAMISHAYFAPGIKTVYVATGMNFPDALAGVPGAARAGAPILLVGTDNLPAATAAEIDRLAPDEIVILGGPAAVHNSVETELSAHAPAVRRLYGKDRYATAATISAAAYPDGADMAFVAVGTNFPDAVAAGPAAAHLGGPLLLSGTATMTSATVKELRRLRPGYIIVPGSENQVGEDAIDQLDGIGIGSLTGRVANLPRP